MKAKTCLALTLAVLLAVVLVAVGCGGGTTTTAPATTVTTSGQVASSTTASAVTTVPPAAAVSVKIGADEPFTGQLSKIGLDTLNVIKYAVEEFNAKQTKIKVTVDESGDDAGEPAKAAVVAEKFSSDTSIVGVIAR